MDNQLILSLIVMACAVACAPDANAPREAKQGVSPPSASVPVDSGDPDAGEAALDGGTTTDTLEQIKHYLNYRYVPGSDQRVRRMGGSLLDRVDGGEYAIWLVANGDTSMIWFSRLLEGAEPDPVRMRWAFKSLWEVLDARILPELFDGTELSFGGFCSDSHGVRRKDLVAIIPAAAVGLDVGPILAWMADPVTERVAPIPVKGIVCRVSREGG